MSFHAQLLMLVVYKKEGLGLFFSERWIFPMALLVSFGSLFTFVNRDYECLHHSSPCREGRAGLLSDAQGPTIPSGRTGCSSSPTGVMWSGSNEQLCRYRGLRQPCDVAWSCSLYLWLLWFYIFCSYTLWISEKVFRGLFCLVSPSM